MLLGYYGLREQPFGVTPNPRYLYLSPTHREALASLLYGIEAGRGFMALVAKPGMGKTTLLFQLLEQLGNSARTVFLFQTHCDPRQFVRGLMADLGVDTGEADMVRMHAKLNDILIREMCAGRRFVLVVDEAQNLDESVLEVVRMLSNFETPRAKLMQIVLAGQLQLADKLARPSLAQLRQRVSIVSRLQPLSESETADYIAHRLRIAGHDGLDLFTPEARCLVASSSEGIPRNINTICFNALSLGYALGRKAIDSEIIKEVVDDLDLTPMFSEAAGRPLVKAGTRSADVPVRERAAGSWAVRLERIPSPAASSAAGIPAIWELKPRLATLPTAGVGHGHRQESVGSPGSRLKGRRGGPIYHCTGRNHFEQKL